MKNPLLILPLRRSVEVGYSQPASGGDAPRQESLSGAKKKKRKRFPRPDGMNMPGDKTDAEDKEDNGSDESQE